MFSFPSLSTFFKEKCMFENKCDLLLDSNIGEFRESKSEINKKEFCYSQ